MAIDLDDYIQNRRKRESEEILTPKQAGEILIADEAAFDPREAAKKELALRELSRRYYLPFVQKFNPDFLAGWFHKDLCLRLQKFSEQVARKESPRLMLFTPPRHGKSQSTSKTFPAWHLGKYPTHEFMCCSYSGSLSMQFSRNVRSIMRDPAYGQLFPTRLDPDSQSVESWLTDAGGGLLAAGVGGAITGKGAHVLIIDDPVKNREDAESPVGRQAVYDWYTSTAYTRLAPGGGILIIMTRWHDDDLAGRLLEESEKGGDEWEVVSYPAIATHEEDYRVEGEALHPERYPEPALRKIERAIGPRDWSALYQQNPVPDRGSYFQKENIKFYRQDDLPPDDELRHYQAWDLAIGQKEYNDYSCGMDMAVDTRETYYLMDNVRFKGDTYEIINAICDLYRRHTPDIVGIEKGAIEMAIGPVLQKEIQAQKLYGMYVEGLKVGKQDKQLRARSIQGLIRAGKVRFPHPDECAWVKSLMDELLRFPAATHDDQVDTLAHLGRMIENMSPVHLRPEAKPKSWRDNLSKYLGNDGKDLSHMSA